MYIPNTRTDAVYNRKKVRDAYGKGYLDAMQYVCDEVIDTYLANREDDYNPETLSENMPFLSKRECREKFQLVKHELKNFKEWLERETDDICVGFLDNEAEG